MAKVRPVLTFLLPLIVITLHDSVELQTPAFEGAPESGQGSRILKLGVVNAPIDLFPINPADQFAPAIVLATSPNIVLWVVADKHRLKRSLVLFADACQPRLGHLFGMGIQAFDHDEIEDIFRVEDREYFVAELTRYLRQPRRPCIWRDFLISQHAAAVADLDGLVFDHSELIDADSELCWKAQQW